ncbi:hypothetical protein ACHAQA_007866 [Verticillium albo-atrum]
MASNLIVTRAVKKAQRGQGHVAVTPAQEMIRTRLRGRKVTPAGTWLLTDEDRKKTFDLLYKLPIELRYTIYDEILDDMNPNITYVTLKWHHGQRYCHMTMGNPSRESKWRWGDDLMEAIPEMRRFIERAIGTHKKIRCSPLRTVRRDKDLAVYCFNRGHFHVDWRIMINKTASMMTLGPGIQNIGVRFGDNFAGGFTRPDNATLHTMCGARLYCNKVCPDQLANFIDNFPDVKSVYLLLMLHPHDMRVARKKKAVRELIIDLIAQGEKDGRAKFEDRSRVWIEIFEDRAKDALSAEMFDVFKVATKAKTFLNRNRGMTRSLSAQKRDHVKIRVLVTTFYLQ